jgi:molybdate transport system ATP-binding protein
MSAALHARRFQVELDVAAGERLAVLGQNGAGKSTLLSVLAGVVRPDTGRAVLADTTLYALGGRRRLWLPPPQRGIALLAQDPMLFPHLSVLDNVAFGPRAAGVAATVARRDAGRWLERVGVPDLAGRRPDQLSGGQAQRVAIARALATSPALMLLDEPLGALDVAAAATVRQVLRRVLADRTALIVTHDLLDALLLCTRVVVIDDGRIVEAGPTHDVITRPRTPFIARMAGLNLVRGVATAPAVLRAGAEVAIEGTAAQPLPVGAGALAVFNPNAVAVYPLPPHGSPRNTFAVVITELEPGGGQVRVRALDRAGHALAADVTPAAVGDLDLHPGVAAYFCVKATAVTLYPAADAG